MTSSGKTPRRLISDYPDASKTQILSPHRRQARGIPRTPESYGRSRKQVLSHDRVSSLRGKRRSISSFDDEDTPRQLISQFLANADTTAPLVRHGRRTSQSGVVQSQPALPVSYKRQRRSSNFSNNGIEEESETPRTLINRFLQNASHTVDTPVVRHQSSYSNDSPNHVLVQETYNTPSPFKESSHGSVDSTRMSAHRRSRLSRSATKNLTGNYSLVIPETQGLNSSPSTERIFQQTEYDIPSIFGSSDSEEETPLPDISRFSKSRHRQGGYNLTVPETMLERSDYREDTEYENQSRRRDEYEDRRDREEYRDSSTLGRDRSSLRRSVVERDRYEYEREREEVEDEGMEDRQMEEEDRQMAQQDRQMEEEGYREYELPMARGDYEEQHYEHRDMYEDTLGGANQNSSIHDDMRFSPRISSTQQSRTETEETRELVREAVSQRMSGPIQDISYNTLALQTGQTPHQSLHKSQTRSISLMSSPHGERHSPRGVRSRSLGVTESSVSHTRSPRRSAPQPGSFGGMEASPIVSGRAYLRGRNVQEHVDSIAEQFSPRISSTQKTIYMEQDPTRETTPPRMSSPLQTMTPSPVVSPDQHSPTASDEGKVTPPKSASRRLYSNNSMSRSPLSSRSRTPLSTRSRTRRGSGESSIRMNNIHNSEHNIDVSARLEVNSAYAGSETGSVSNLGIRISTPFSAQKTPNRSPLSSNRSVTESSASSRSYTPQSRSQAPQSRSKPQSRSHTPQSMSQTPQSRSQTPQSRSQPQSRLQTPQSRSETPQSRSKAPQSMSQTHQSRSETPQSRFKTPQSKSQTPQSRSQTQRSIKQQLTQESPRSPVIAGRMNRRPDRDMVHTLPNTTAFFSPQVASTQELAHVAQRNTEEDIEHREPVQEMDDQNEADDSLHHTDENVEDGEPLDDAADKENDNEWEDADPIVHKEAGGAAESEAIKQPQKAPRKPRAKNPYIIPMNLVKKRFTHYAGMRVAKDTVKSVMDVSEKYWSNIAVDLTAYANHAGRKKITMADMVLLFKRQGHVTERQSMTALIERHLPMEEREKLIPCARAFNKIELNRTYINP